MITYEQYKKEFDKECPGAYGDSEIKSFYWEEYILHNLKHGAKFDKKFLKENLDEGQIWYLNKHFFPRDQIL
jgi:hypothetical protein